MSDEKRIRKALEQAREFVRPQQVCQNRAIEKAGKCYPDCEMFPTCLPARRIYDEIGAILGERENKILSMIKELNLFHPMAGLKHEKWERERRWREVVGEICRMILQMDKDAHIRKDHDRGDGTRTTRSACSDAERNLKTPRDVLGVLGEK